MCVEMQGFESVWRKSFFLAFMCMQSYHAYLSRAHNVYTHRKSIYSSIVL